MNHNKYNQIIELNSKSQLEKAKYLCYYAFKENNQKDFSMSEISELFTSFGFSEPNTSRLKNNLIKQKILIPIKRSARLSFVPIVLQKIDLELQNYWGSTEIITSNSELLDESLFISGKKHLDCLVRQINCTYNENCYDATAVLMRRLFEIVLILVFIEYKEEQRIQHPDGTYKMLEDIINEAKSNSTLKLSRIKREYEKFQKTGNFSAHRLDYNARKSDIDLLRIDYRAALEELYTKAKI